jgi:hypothetical protein
MLASSPTARLSLLCIFVSTQRRIDKIHSLLTCGKCEMMVFHVNISLILITIKKHGRSYYRCNNFCVTYCRKEAPTVPVRLSVVRGIAG